MKRVPGGSGNGCCPEVSRFEKTPAHSRDFITVV